MDHIKKNEPIIERLNSAGFNAYFVGGSVRNMFLDIETFDIDIATSAPLDVLILLFINEQCFEKNRYGIHFVSECYSVEITTMRIEGIYLDGRHPENVTYTHDVIADAMRRDFTCNALYYHFEEGIIDPFNGINDIHNRCLRVIGNPLVRFNEDYIRMIRAYRFAAQLGFTMDKEMVDALCASLHQFEKLAYSQYHNELQKFLKGTFLIQTLEQSTHLLRKIIMLDATVNDSEIIKVFKSFVQTPRDETWFCISCVLLIETEVEAKKLLLRLQQNKKNIMKYLAIQRWFHHQKNEIEFTNIAKIIGWEVFLEIIEFECRYQGKNPKLNRAYNLIEKNIFNEIPNKVSSLTIKAQDLKEFGIGNEELSKILNKVLNAVMLGKCEHTREACLKWLFKEDKDDIY